ncbi:MAG: DUF1223 domain-containing protein [Acidobacteriaceae bacterium]|nr:DUF1223 domain-containing protein [Acidobacteriaceae bacterium]
MLLPASRYLAIFALVPIFLHGFSQAGPRKDSPSASTPVFLELFTSEGCSSCPPADKLLADLDRTQPIPGANLIVLSEHVDYWNGEGWSDPYSSPAFTARQEMYASRLDVSEIYTPQLVVDGARSVVGSNWPKVKKAVEESLNNPKVSVSVVAERSKGTENGALIQVSLGAAPAQPRARVFLVVARDRAQSQVARGENAGRSLSHVAVAYLMREIGATSPETRPDVSVPVSLLPKSHSGDTRVIVFAQEPRTGKVIGVAQTCF